MSGARLHSIWIAPEPRAAMQAVETARAIPGVGLEGDRYAHGVGTFSSRRGRNVRELSLIAHENVQHLANATDTELQPGAARRNLVTEEIELLPLANARLRIGEVEIECTSTCPPCGHLNRLLGVDTRMHLRKRGGLRARIVVGGILAAGMAIEVLHVPPPLP
ncbi:MAG: MOSC domain-containing protein [Planctomycetota bacterium]